MIIFCILQRFQLSVAASLNTTQVFSLLFLGLQLLYIGDHDPIETLSPKRTLAWRASCRSEQSPSLSALAALKWMLEKNSF